MWKICRIYQLAKYLMLCIHKKMIYFIFIMNKVLILLNLTISKQKSQNGKISINCSQNDHSKLSIFSRYVKSQSMFVIINDYNNFNCMDHHSSSIQNHSIANTANHEVKNHEIMQSINQVYHGQQANKNNEQYDSQFLDIDPQMMKKLQKIEQTKQESPQKKENSIKSQSLLPKLYSQQQHKLDQVAIKKEFVHKLKQWDKQREQIKIRKHQIEQKKSKQKLEKNMKKQQQQEEERQFLKLQKQKQIQQKIQQIEQRRQKRQQSLKNALMKRSYNKYSFIQHRIPSFAQAQQRYKQQEQESIELNIRLLKDKQRLSKLDPEQLKLHEKAYIQRIKERLNMVPKSDRTEKAKSDFNLYLKRSEEKKKDEINKIIKMKKYQEKINRIPIKIDEIKKQSKLIQIDKIKNPQKYRLLSQKLLNDQQIYEEFKNFSINIDRKQLGINYLNELKQSHEKSIQKNRKSNTQILKHNPQEKLPTINNKHEFAVKVPAVKHQKSKSMQLLPSQSYKQSLDKNKERDSRYMKALQKKLSMAIDM